MSTPAPTENPKAPAESKPRRRRPPLKRVQRVDLVQEVVDRLREQVVSGRFAPDTPLPPEGELGRTLGVSRTVIREAMRTLRAQGLVEVSQGRRPRVKPADPRDLVQALGTFLQRGDHSLLHLTEVRIPLETEIASMAAQRATPAQIEAMETALRRMTAAGKLDDQIEADVEFHNLLAVATGNPVFELLLATLAGLMRQSRRRTLSRTGLARADAGHLAVLAAVRQADPRRAREAMREHLTMAQEDLRGDHP